MDLRRAHEDVEPLLASAPIGRRKPAPVEKGPGPRLPFERRRDPHPYLLRSVAWHTRFRVFLPSAGGCYKTCRAPVDKWRRERRDCSAAVPAGSRAAGIRTSGAPAAPGAPGGQVS